MQSKYLSTLESLLEIDALDVRSALDNASDFLAEVMGADKIDGFMYDPSNQTLLAVGTSNTPMAAHQKAIGMDRLPLANGGREVEVYETGEPYISGHLDLDVGALPGFRYELGAKSMIIVPIEIQGKRRGVIQAASARPEAFTMEDLRFLQAVGRWVGLVVHRAELVERVTQDTAEQAKRSTAEELVTVLAHDLNNLLTPLSGRVQLIQRRARREGRELDIRDAQEISRAVHRLGCVVNDLLDVSKLDQGLFSITPERIDLAALVRDTATILDAREHKVDVRAPEELIADADPARVRQALENLVSNASKHSPDGVPVVVELGVENREEGQWAVIKVQDKGPGIPAEMMPRLFTRFGAGHDSNGLGLGLYLTRSIVEAHGGTVGVDSEYTGGASLRLSLPIRTTDSAIAGRTVH